MWSIQKLLNSEIDIITYQVLIGKSSLRNDKCTIVCLFVFGATAPHWARASSFTRFLDHAQRRTTVGRTPLDE